MMSTKTVFATLMGRPNVGKSTLLNQIIGEKISIVSPKPQTTRTRITGILTKGDVQYVFLDMPGFITGKSGLGKRMEQTVSDTVEETEIALFVAEAKAPNEAEKRMLERLKKMGIPAFLVLNKVDAIPKEKILSAIAAFTAEFSFDAVIPLSAKTGDGVDLLLGELEQRAEESPFFFDPDQLSDQSEAVFACEVVREKMLYLLGQEVPHGVALAVDAFEEEEDLISIYVVIYCSKDSHKGMIIGKGGAKLKEISSRARVELEQHFGKKVFLKCFVKVKRDWENNAGLLDSLGFSQE
ncbi:MAG: GTPase Era [Clostridia bacterium]|nr:GTPase Era [Clostridia bacterium]